MDFSQLELLYQKLYALSIEIKENIENKDYNNLLPLINRKDPLISNIQQLKKELQSLEIPQELKELEEKINLQELENIQVLEKNKEEVKYELKKLNKDIRLVSAYSQNENISSIIDIKE